MRVSYAQAVYGEREIKAVVEVLRDPNRIVAGQFTGSEGSPASARSERRLQVQDSLMFLRGHHLLKAGADVRKSVPGVTERIPARASGKLAVTERLPFMVTVVV